MHRYFAFICNDGDSRGMVEATALACKLRARDSTWEVTFQSGGLLVLQAGQQRGRFQSYCAPQKGGIVIGKLFRRRDEDQIDLSDVKLADEDITNSVDSKGRSFGAAFWGRYVAFLLNSQGTCVAMRDPSGAVPAYYSQLGRVTAVYSRLADCVQVAPDIFTIDWSHLTTFLQYDRPVTRSTGLREVKMLHAGEIMEFGGTSIKSSFFWHPANFCRETSLEDPEVAVRALRQAVLLSVQSWASCYDQILHDLSGGLDSSIVAACLATSDRPTEILCCNLFTNTPEGDERPFARMVAKRTGLRLLEEAIIPYKRGAGLQFSVPSIPSPMMTAFASVNEENRIRLVSKYGIQATFSGQGGDHLFQQVPTSLTAADYVFRHGLGRDVGSVIRDACIVARQPLSSVLKTIAMHGFLKVPFDPYREALTSQLLTPDMARPGELRHPWVLDSGDLPRAKLQQVFFIVDSQVLHMFAGACSYVDVVHPLISQPLIESCLRIPAYTLVRGGRDRALARRAFASDLPNEIVSRTTKGGANGYFHNMILDNVAFLREFLIDGLLTREGLVDRASMEQALSLKRLYKGNDMFAILTAARAEAWARETTAQVNHRAAA